MSEPVSRPASGPASGPALEPSVWADVVGQPAAVARLRAAAVAAGAGARVGGLGAQADTDADAMTHAWLCTGPPGSGRSVAARAFAAALQCARHGCGSCQDCRTVLAGTHADVAVIAPEGLSISVTVAREIVARASLAPSRRRWNVVIIEDADRLTESAANALLKLLEEPPPRCVLVLCAPSTQDVLPTIRSRCRLVTLRVPAPDAVAEVLVRRDGIEPEKAAFAARAAQGHVGRARRLARDPRARHVRDQVLAVPTSLTTVGTCFAEAAALVAAADEESAQLTAPIDAEETARLRTALGAREGSSVPRGGAGPLKELERAQRSRGTRTKRDALDRALVDLAALFRDVLAVQLGADVPLVHGDRAEAVRQQAQASRPEATLRRLEAVLACREAIAANVAPLLAAEAMTLTVQAG